MNLKANGKCLNLTAMETRMLLGLLGRRTMWIDDLVEIMWPHPDDQPDQWYNALRVHIYRIRKKLEHCNSELKIINRFGKGFMVV